MSEYWCGICHGRLQIHCTNWTFNNLKVLETGPLRFGIGNIYKTFPAEKVTFHKGHFFGWKCFVKVSFNSPFLNLKGSISKTFKLSKI